MDLANLHWTAQRNSGTENPSHVLYGSGETPTLPEFIRGSDPSEYYLVPEYTDPAMLGTFNQVTRANHAGTDWFNEIFGPANTMQHDISVSGGSAMGNLDRQSARLNSSHV